jgi:NADH-quinone oxidoreductase subunit L
VVRWVVIGLLLFAAGLTAFYVTRLWVRVFGGKVECSAHEGNPLMLLPMGVLAGITLLVGWTQPVFMEFLGEHGAWPDPLMAGLSVTVFVGGAGLGWLVYARGAVATGPLKDRFRGAYGVLSNKFYFDSAYDAFLVRPYRRLAAWLSGFDLSVIDGAVNGVAAAWTGFAAATYRSDLSIIDGAVNGLAVLVGRAGARVRKIEVGRVQVYQRLAYVGLLFVLLLVLLLVPTMKGA